MAQKPARGLSFGRSSFGLLIRMVFSLLALLVALHPAFAARAKHESPTLSPFDHRDPLQTPKQRIYSRYDPGVQAPFWGQSDAPAEDSPATAPSKLQSCTSLPVDGPLLPALEFIRQANERLKTQLPCFAIRDQERQMVESVITGTQIDTVLFWLRQFARSQAMVVWIFPEGPRRLRWQVQVAGEQAPGLRFVDVHTIEMVAGRLGQHDIAAELPRIRKFLGIQTMQQSPWFADDLVQLRLETLGYSYYWQALGMGRMRLVLEAGHKIRRIKFHGHFPLSARELRSEIPQSAQIGRLSPLLCEEELASPRRGARGRKARKQRLQQLPCAQDDIACHQWRLEVIESLQNYLQSRGYLDATVQVSLQCNAGQDQAQLHLWLDRGPLYRIDSSKIRLRGDAAKLPDFVQRQIEREFLPLRINLGRNVLPNVYNQRRLDGIKERIRLRLSEPDRSFGSYFRPGQRPYPNAAVDIKVLPNKGKKGTRASRRLAVDVDIDLGEALQVQFAPRFTPELTYRPLSIRRPVLLRQLQLFSRREAPSAVIAQAEASKLRAFLQSRGFPLAEVQGEYQDFQSLQRLRFEIDEGPTATIQSISVHSSDNVPPKLARQLNAEWRRDRKLNRRGYFSDNEALQDLGLLTELYRNAGYPCANAYVKLAFWPKGLTTSGAFAAISASSLLQGGGGTALWPTDLDESGLEAIRSLERTKIYLEFNIVAGPRLLVADVPPPKFVSAPPSVAGIRDDLITTKGRWGPRRILYKTPLGPEEHDPSTPIPVNTDLQRNTENAITQKYQEAGHPLAETRLKWKVILDPDQPAITVRELRELADPETGICNAYYLPETIPAEAEIYVYEGGRGKFGDTVFRGNFKTRTRTLEKELLYRSDQPYTRSAVERSVQGIESLGVTRAVGTTPFPIGCTEAGARDCEVHHAFEIREASDLFMDVRYGLGAATLNPLYVFIQPTFPNLAGTAWRLRLDGSYGFDLVGNRNNIDICDRAQCFERRAGGEFSRAHLPGMNVGVQLGGQYQRRMTPARGEVITINATGRLNWRLRNGLAFYTGYRFQRANLSEDMVKPIGGSSGTWVNRAYAVVRDNTGLIEGGLQYNRLDNPFNPSRGYLINVDLAQASRWLGGGDWWSKIDISWQHFIPLNRLSPRLSLRYALRYGQIFPFRFLDTQTAPKIWRYYGGGSFDLGIRGIQPETLLADVEEIPAAFGPSTLRIRAQGGHLRLLGTFALQWVSVRDLFGGKLAHSIFYDSGYLLQDFQNAHWGRDYRHSVGVNALKFDINLATLALGYAVLLPPNRRVFDDRNGRFVFDVGITF